MRSYTELSRLQTFQERFEYLKDPHPLFDETFGNLRWLNQQFYTSYRWKKVHDKVIIRDHGCDLGILDYPIQGLVYVHHVNPVTPEALINDEEWLCDPEFLISTSYDTHSAITYGTELPQYDYISRKEGDTVLWNPLNVRML